MSAYPLFDLLNDEQKAWIEERPPNVREVAKRYPPTRVYRLGTSLVTIVSYEEPLDETAPVTVKVYVGEELNGFLFMEREVFGVKPQNLEDTGPIEGWEPPEGWTPELGLKAL